MDYQLTQTGPEVQEILDKGAESYSKAEIDAQVDELQDGIDSSVKNKGSESNIVFGVGNSSNIGITSSSIGMETGNSAILIGNDITMNTSGEVKYNGSRVATAADLQGKQDVIRDLQTIRDGASAGATAVQPAALTPIQSAISVIEDLIPSAASAQNQLADKNYVDTHSTDIDVDDELSTTSENPVQNKVVTTALNGKQATISDLSTIRSGAAAGATAVQPAAMNTALAGKQDTISDLATIRSGASAGATAVQPAAMNTALAGKQDTISDLSTIRSGASAGATAVQPAAMNTALASKQDTLTFDNAPTANSNNPVKSGGVKTAIDAKQDTISTVNVTVDNNTGTPSGSASVSGSTLSLSFQNLKGATGAQGPQGIQGVQGVQGPKGDTGVTGDASSLAIIHGIDKTSTYTPTDVCGADAAQALLNEIEGGFYY